MALSGYGVLAARVLEGRSERDADTPHYQIRVSGQGVEFRVAVNVLSQQAPSELLFVAAEAFQHPLLESLPNLPDGFSAVPSQPGGVALDYIRGNLFDRTRCAWSRRPRQAPDNDLADKIEHFVSRAAADSNARLYAFGQRWAPRLIPRTRSSASRRETVSTTST
jgi:uncharacterized protein YukJ